MIGNQSRRSLYRISRSICINNKLESKVLKYLREKDKEDKYGIVSLIEYFKYKNNYVMIFEPLGLSLYEILKISNYKGLSMKQV